MGLGILEIVTRRMIRIAHESERVQMFTGHEPSPKSSNGWFWDLIRSWEAPPDLVAHERRYALVQQRNDQSSQTTSGEPPHVKGVSLQRKKRGWGVVMRLVSPISRKFSARTCLIYKFKEMTGESSLSDNLINVSGLLSSARKVSNQVSPEMCKGPLSNSREQTQNGWVHHHHLNFRDKHGANGICEGWSGRRGNMDQTKKGQKERIRPVVHKIRTCQDDNAALKELAWQLPLYSCIQGGKALLLPCGRRGTSATTAVRRHHTLPAPSSRRHLTSPAVFVQTSAGAAHVHNTALASLPTKPLHPQKYPVQAYNGAAVEFTPVELF
ncbi:hypothetical protein EDB85DRAFT_2277410 [Lactarius pseudohatsudake]|nr:hypothetical protein EDB85DRAFT_2277410 [Lactarius pseudohatsudake]